jgi:hypothetical protein
MGSGITCIRGKALPNRVVLDNVEHHALRVARSGSAELDQVNQTLIVPTEFEDVQREYPIFFRKDAEGKFVAIALLGLDKGENLFIDDGQWNARHIPSVHRRGPFFLGARETDETERELTLHIDLDDPRVSEAEGEPLFKPHGGNTPYLEHVAEALHTIHEGLAAAPVMFSLFEELELIQPIQLKVELGDGLTYNLPNFFTVGEQQFRSLSGESLERLNRAGFLAAAIFVRASLGNIARLIELKNRKNGQL